jgi:hypothetical protein
LLAEASGLPAASLDAGLALAPLARLVGPELADRAVVDAQADEGWIHPLLTTLAQELAARWALALDDARLMRQLHEALEIRMAFLAAASDDPKHPIARSQGYTRPSRSRASPHYMDRVGADGSQSARLATSDGPVYAQLLRAIGRLLGAERSARAHIELDEETITVSWLTDAGRWTSQPLEPASCIRALECLAPVERGTGAPEPGDRLEEWLRTLGQELDAQGMAVAQLRVGRGFQVSGRVAGRPVDYWYSTDELRERSVGRQQLRTPQQAVLTSWWRRLGAAIFA